MLLLLLFHPLSLAKFFSPEKKKVKSVEKKKPQRAQRTQREEKVQYTNMGNSLIHRHR